MEDSLRRVLDDVDDVFGYRDGVRPGGRAHDYLDRNNVARDARDTAMQRAVYDMVQRAYAVGLVETRSAEGAVSEVLTALGEALLEVAEDGE